jgi:hypothetical protein
MVLQGKNMTQNIAYVSIFTALGAVLDVIPIIPGFYSGIWDSWLFLLSPVIGILLGPYYGAISVGTGSLIGHVIYFRDPFELVFMWGAPLGAAIAGFIYEKKWQPVLGIYGLLLGIYLIYPVTWMLPLWGIWDILVGFGLILVFIFLVRMEKSERIRIGLQTLTIAFAAVIGLEADILFRVFVLVPGQAYWFFYGFTVADLQYIWLSAGFITPIKVLLSAIATIMITKTVLLSVEQSFHNEQNQEM